MKPFDDDDFQIGTDDHGEWEEMPKLDRLFFAGAFLLFVVGVLAWGGFL
jgi:hypothetical protein